MRDGRTGITKSRGAAWNNPGDVPVHFQNDKLRKATFAIDHVLHKCACTLGNSFSFVARWLEDSIFSMRAYTWLYKGDNSRLMALLVCHKDKSWFYIAPLNPIRLLRYILYGTFS